ncbi:MAG: hypothetical protein KF700_02970, partial [Hyphomonadaceae bacterium]|nr:hypothetical protein [Hyphomonadaceae bacterium]
SGVAMLATMDDERVREALKALDREITNHPRITHNILLRAVTAARANGYGLVRDTTVLGIGGVGVVLPAKAGRPMLGLGVAMPSERLSAARVEQIYRLLCEARAKL